MEENAASVDTDVQADDVIIEGSESAPEGSEIPEANEAQHQDAQPAQDTQEAQDGQQEQPEWFQKRINELTFKYREEERKRQAAEAEANKVREQLPQDARPEIPPIPDQFDDGYEQKLAERDKALKARTEWDTRQALKAAVEQREAQRKQQEAYEAYRKTEEGYVNRAKEAGIQPQDLQQMGQFFSSFVTDPNIQGFVLEHEAGPQIVQHLSRNPDQLQAIASMPPMMAAAHIAANIAPNVTAKPQTTSAPPPPPTLDGGGTPPDDGVPGATYE